MNLRWNLTQGIFDHIHHRGAMDQHFTWVHPDHQLHIFPFSEEFNRAFNPFGHRLAENLAPKGQAVTKHIGRQQHHRPVIQPQFLPDGFAAFRGRILPLAGEIFQVLASCRAEKSSCSLPRSSSVSG